MYKKPRESCFCYEIYTEYSVSMRSQCEPQYPPAITQHLMFTKHPNIWSMIQTVLLSSPLTRLHISYTCVKINFVQIVRKVFSLPLRCRILWKGNLRTRQMWAVNCPPCDGNPTDARLKSTQPGSLRTLHVLRLPKWSDIGQRLISSYWFLQTVWPVEQSASFLACRELGKVWYLLSGLCPQLHHLYPSQSKIHQPS